jgi:hypothetical protein
MKKISRQSLVEKYIARVKNHPFVALLIVIGISVIAIAQFTDAVQKLLDLIPADEEKLPDLIIYKVDLENSKIHITNRGEKPAPTDKLYLAWSEGWYQKPEWNNSIVVGQLKYVDYRLILPGESLPIVVKGLENADKATEFMIDAGEMIEESDESNNSVNTDGEVVPSRRSLKDDILEMTFD